MAGAPLGNKNAANRGVIRKAFKDYATENPQDLRALVVKLYVEALNGNIQAAALIFDRTEGKASQPLTGDEENPIAMVQRVQREIVRAHTDNPDG